MNGGDRNCRPSGTGDVRTPASSVVTPPNTSRDITQNDALEEFITKVREDAALCDLLKQRRARWLEEEEEFAKFLVQEFEHGIARNVQNNSTLRAYLSRKLICTPMRISKKFVGKKVGTIFFKKEIGILPHIAEISAQTHLELEKKCLSALISAMGRSREVEQKVATQQVKSDTQRVSPSKSHTIPNQVPANTCHFPEHQGNFNINQNLIGQQGYPYGQQMYGSANNQANLETGVYINGQQNGCQLHFAGTNRLMQTQGCGQSVQPASYLDRRNSGFSSPPSQMPSPNTCFSKPGHPVQPVSSNSRRNSIVAGPSLQMQSQTAGFTRPGPVPSNDRRNSILTWPSVQIRPYASCHPRSEQPVHPAAFSDGRNSSHSNSPIQMQSYNHRYTKPEESVQPAIFSGGWNSPVSCSPAPVKHTSTNALAGCAKASIQSMSKSRKISVAIGSGFVATKSSCSGSLDLVSGFDKHTASLNAERQITAVLESRPTSTTWPENSHFFAGSIGESPYITSKSFDEMHRCLGINLPSNPSHLDLTETKAQTNNVKPDKQATLPAESPYITSKSFDEMHKCLGIGLSSSTMSHFDLNGASVGSSKPQDIDSPSAYAGSNLGVDINATMIPSGVDPRSNKLLSAFSPFDGASIMHDPETDPSNFDAMIRSVMSPGNAHTSNSGSDFVGNESNSRYGHDVGNYFKSGQTAVAGNNASRSYQTPFEYGLSLSLLHGSRATSQYPKAVSASASERSSDRGVNSSPDCTDIQSD